MSAVICWGRNGMMSTKVYQVALVEDDPATRERIKTAVQKHPELNVIASAANCHEGREIIKTHQLDVLLVDLGLPDGHGTELIQLAQSKSPATEIMVITVFGDEKNVLTAIESGATGYLLKDGDAGYIGESIKQMLDGGSPISASIARHLLKRFKIASEQQANAEDMPKLTNREKEVLALVAKGFSYAEISTTLGMSVNTVTSHIKHIYRKLNVNSRGEAVFEALQLGLIKTFR